MAGVYRIRLWLFWCLGSRKVLNNKIYLYILWIITKIRSFCCPKKACWCLTWLMLTWPLWHHWRCTPSLTRFSLFQSTPFSLVYWSVKSSNITIKKFNMATWTFSVVLGADFSLWGSVSSSIVKLSIKLLQETYKTFHHPGHICIQRGHIGL